ncbi:MAG: response regulator [Burkholderiales bacterium]|nr:response regulator [Burkholderiales bacterium]
MKVVVVDDNAVNRTLLVRLVQRLENASAVALADAASALAWCAERRPDLVIVDYMMPDLDGLAFIERFRALPEAADTPLLMVTADRDLGTRYRALDCGATDFLTKPVDHREFLARVRNMLKLRAAQNALAGRATWLAAEVATATAGLVTAERETLMCLARAAEYRDPETGAHILRMANYSRLIARELGVSEAEQQLVLEAAPMHDVGKLGTPDHILLRPGKLTPEEFEIMQQHAIIGWEILRSHGSRALQAGAVIAYTHHEKFDGSGYPRGLAGEDIPLFGRIVAVADVFDALSSVRPYKPAWPVAHARELLLKQSGRHFDPACVRAFLGVWDEALEIKNRYCDG